ncbi:Reverse transcriptase domain-containing protein [Aphis craccivora]|uniref:Reverse transcriptase domain-containing protein n=1 Tax=Aphis craccivora TaxID=307492 RepID=A0A6G0ZAP5_APHCR|nr:Reverse transcriptase domain-containing protein [Aphis craccivora]
MAIIVLKNVFVAFSIYNSAIPFNHICIHSCDTNDLNLNLCNCQKLIKVTRLHVEYLVMSLRSIISKLFKLNKLLPTEILRIVYNSLYKSIFRHGLLVWGGCTDNAIRPLEILQNLAIRICLNKKELYVLPVRYLYKQFSIMFQIDNFGFRKNNRRENKSYEMQVNYTNKSFGKKFVDYLSPINFNSLPLYLKIIISSNENKNNFITNKKTINLNIYFVGKHKFSSSFMRRIPHKKSRKFTNYEFNIGFFIIHKYNIGSQIFSTSEPFFKGKFLVEPRRNI